jgi:hypothetical protein
MSIGVIDANGSYIEKYFACARNWIGKLYQLHYIRSAELRNLDCSHAHTLLDKAEMNDGYIPSVILVAWK